MNFKKDFRKLLLIYLIFFCLININSIKNVKGTNTTIYINDTYDDLFVTEAGLPIYTSPLLPIVYETQNIRTFLRFENMPFTRADPINNVTLNLFSNGNEVATSPILVTVYGLDEDNCPVFTQGETPFQQGVLLDNRPLTSNLASWNLTLATEFQYYGVEVTNIVREIKNRWNWESGNSIGFVIYSTSNTTRNFWDYSLGNTNRVAYLDITYDVSPSVPTGIPQDSEYVEDYNNWTIWRYETSSIALISERSIATEEIHFTDFLNNTSEIVTNSTWQSMGQARHTLLNINGTWLALVGDSENNEDLCVYNSTDGENWAKWLTVSTGNEDFPLYGGFVYDETTSTLHFISIVEKAGYANRIPVYRNYTYGIGFSASQRLAHSSQGDANYGDIEIDNDGNVYMAWHMPDNATNINNVYFKERFANGTFGNIVGWDTGDQMRYPNIDVEKVYTSGLTPWIMLTFHRSGAGQDYIRADWRNRTVQWNGAVTVAGASDLQPSLAIDQNNIAWCAYQSIVGALTYEIRIQRWNFTSQIWAFETTISQADDCSVPSIGIDVHNDKYVAWRYALAGAVRLSYNVFDNNTGWFGVRDLNTTGRQQPNVMRMGTFSAFRYYGHNNETGNIVNCLSVQCIKNQIDQTDPDPEDPNPANEWDDTGAFTRFRTRMYIFWFGFFCFFAPLWYIALGHREMQTLFMASIIMLLGIGLMMSTGQF